MLGHESVLPGWNAFEVIDSIPLLADISLIAKSFSATVESHIWGLHMRAEVWSWHLALASWNSHK